MRRILNFTLVIFLIAGICSFAFAEEPKKGMMDKEMMGGKGMMMKPGMMGMGPMHMMHKEMIATKDGGIVVMVGNKLLKYDKDLNLKKEVEIKMDMAGTRMMKEMMKKCPMRKMMMEKGMMGEDEAETTGAEESDMPSGHEAHH